MNVIRPRSRSVAIMAGSALALATAVAVVPAVAATPAGGSVSDTSPTATWTAGPFAVPNVTGTAGDVTCSAATPVDDCTLWYTTEYEKATGAFQWSTWISTIKLPGCV